MSEKTSIYGSKMRIKKELDKDHFFVEFENGYQINATKKAWNSGHVKNPEDRTCYGVGYIGFGKYRPSIDGVKQPQYKRWYEMIRRCYSPWKQSHIAYIDCSVSDEFLNLQNFGAWHDENYYEIPNMKMQLDKDLFSDGINKIYSKNTCCFLPQEINKFFITPNHNKSIYPLGVMYKKKTNKYVAQCGNRADKYIGTYNTAEEAAQAYINFKENQIHKFAEDYKKYLPDRVYWALINYKLTQEK